MSVFKKIIKTLEKQKFVNIYYVLWSKRYRVIRLLNKARFFKK